ncbi:hypothetical protein [Streptomyces sp. DH41]|nr:hypothetical protein [Streptomyces sp. DH41]MDG9723792.1 hypothetical protein [Streptomyces sp. DH41]
MPQVAADEAIEVFDPVMGDVIGVRVGTEKETGVAVESSDGP